MYTCEYIYKPNMYRLGRVTYDEVPDLSAAVGSFPTHG